MKRNIRLLTLLCLFLTTATASAQELQPGDKIPDLLIKNIKGLTLNGKPVTETHLADFHGKLLILDFWATWCAPCRKMIPVMDSLQRQFSDRVQFLPVTYESETVTAPVLAAMQKIKPFDLPEVTSDITLNKRFPHRSLPHYVWISPDGTLLATTEEKDINAQNIRNILDGKRNILGTKRDSVTHYDPAQPLLIAGNGGNGTGFLYHSLLSHYKPGLNSGISISPFDPNTGQRFTARNVPFPWLCRLAYGENGRAFPPSRTRINTRDSLLMDTRLQGQNFKNWLDAGNGWCYELALPPRLANKAYPMMQADLARLFPAYTVSVQQQKTRCLALVRTTPEDKLHSQGGPTTVDITPFKADLRNAPLSQLLMRLERQYLQNSALPIVDQTHYTTPVDLHIETRLDNLPALNQALAPYGLRFTEKEATVEVLVIADQPNNQPKP